MTLACSTLDSYCTSCSSSSSCTACSGGRLIYGSSCVASCSTGTYSDGTYCKGIFLGGSSLVLIALIACTTLDSSCTTCNSSSTCLSCSSGKYALGKNCVSSCTTGTYNNGGLCTCNLFFWGVIYLLACSTVNSYCTSCTSSTTCTGCSSGKYLSGVTCVATCPSGTYPNSGVCTGKNCLMPCYWND